MNGQEGTMLRILELVYTTSGETQEAALRGEINQWEGGKTGKWTLQR